MPLEFPKVRDKILEFIGVPPEADKARADAIKTFLPNIQQMQQNSLQLEAMRADRDKQLTISSIVASSFVDGKYDAVGAATRMRKAGYADEANKTLAEDLNQSKTDMGIQKTMQEIEDSRLKAEGERNVQRGALFASVLGAQGDTATAAAFARAVQQGQENGLIRPEEIPQNMTPSQMKAFATMGMQAAGNIGNNIEWILGQRRLDMETQRLGLEKDKEDGPDSLKIIARKMIENDRAGLSPYTGLTTTQKAIWDEKYGEDVFKMVLDSIAKNDPDFFQKMMRNPAAAFNKIIEMSEHTKLVLEQGKKTMFQNQVERDNPDLKRKRLANEVPAADDELRRMGVTRDEIAAEAMRVGRSVGEVLEAVRRATSRK